MPLLQKSKFLPDPRTVADFYGDSAEEIVFVPVESELASRSSSMEVLRKVSNGRYHNHHNDAAAADDDDVDDDSDDDSYESDDDNDEIKPIVNNKNNKHQLPLPRPKLRREPSAGMDAAGPPPLRRGMHELSIRITRIEI
jgi:hypothetical protein